VTDDAVHRTIGLYADTDFFLNLVLKVKRRTVSR
jgi:hypothetical protein